MSKNSWYLRRHIDTVLNTINPRYRATNVRIFEQRKNVWNKPIRARENGNDIAIDYKHYEYI